MLDSAVRSLPVLRASVFCSSSAVVKRLVDLRRTNRKNRSEFSLSRVPLSGLELGCRSLYGCPTPTRQNGLTWERQRNIRFGGPAVPLQSPPAVPQHQP